MKKPAKRPGRPGRITFYVCVVGPYRCRARSVTVGAIFLPLVTFIWSSQWTCSVGTFSFSWCTIDRARVYGTTKEALATGHAIPVTGQFLPFVAMTNDPTLLRRAGRFGPEYKFRNGHVDFFDAQMDADGCWLIPVGSLSAFVKTAKVPNYPLCHSHTYPAPAGYQQPPSGWTCVRPEGTQPLPATIAAVRMDE